MNADEHQFLNPKRRQVAIIGTGISGLSAAWALHQSQDITIFEANDYIGGHTNTVAFDAPDGPARVDTGFIVYNEPNYPNLTALFDQLGVASDQTKMHFSVSVRDRGLEYGTNGLGGIFAQKRNLLSPRYYAMIADIIRFYRRAPELAAEETDISIGEFLRAENYSDGFARDHLTPMAAAIWSCPADEMMNFPAKSLAQFFVNHGLVELGTPFYWRSVSNGSASYIPKLTAGFADRIRLNCAVRQVLRTSDGVQVETTAGDVEKFDAVILAVHGPQAKRIFANPKADEREVLSAFKTQPNRAVLHTDPSFMPSRRKAWASWNYLCANSENNDLSVTYWMNELQNLQTTQDVFVTLNPSTEPSPESVIGSYNYEHPIFDAATIKAQRDIWSFQGRGGIWYAGAWLGFGFHEDGIQAGLAVAESMTGWERPWEFDRSNERIQRQLQQNVSLIRRAA